MATGKERGYKDWKLGKEFKRSARSYTESDSIARASSKSKNTKKWCKGKVGRKHTLAIYNKYTMTHNYKCLKCGKEFWGKLDLTKFDLEPKRWEDVN